MGVLIPLYLFVSMAEEVWDHDGFALDEKILTFAHGLASPTLNTLMAFFSKIGGALVMVPFEIAIVFTLMLLHRREMALFFTLAVGGAALLNFIAKHSFGRARPDLWLTALPDTTFSFPSGHAMNSTALAAAIAVLAWRTRWRWPVIVVGAAFALCVSVSRVYLGLHYPSDILAGWSASLAWVIGLGLATDWVSRSRSV